MKAVCHHPQTPSCCVPVPSPLLLTIPPLSDKLNPVEFLLHLWLLCLAYPCSEVQGLALFNLRNNRQGSPAGGSTDFSAGCLKDVKGRFGMCVGCVCGRLPVTSSFQVETAFFTGIGWWDQGIILLKDILMMSWFYPQDHNYWTTKTTVYIIGAKCFINLV